VTDGSPVAAVLSFRSRHSSGDALSGVGAPDFNWVVQKIAFQDVGGNEIGSVVCGLVCGENLADYGGLSCLLVTR